MTDLRPVDGKEIEAALRQRAAEKILVLDGAMGTVIQRLGYGEADFRGGRFTRSRATTRRATTTS